MTTARTGKPIVIADYDPQWPQIFRDERQLIFDTVGDGLFERIEHVGSTAVPGLAAKPIVDMMPGVRSLADVTPDVIARFASIGYEYVPEYEQPNDVDEGAPERRYFRKDRDGARALHVHLVEKGSEWWVKHLRFRNYLRYFPEDRDAYADLKRAIAADYNAKMGASWGSTELNIYYTDNKTDFVEGALAKFAAQIDAHARIVVAPYDERWPRFSAAERARLAAALGPHALAIEHVGSTSVPGLAAKPTIDTCVGVADMPVLDEFRPIMIALGYKGLRLNEHDWGYAPLRTQEMNYNTHFVPYGGERWKYYLDFRDYLRAHSDVAEAYAALKLANAQEFDRDILGYIEAKAEFVVDMRTRSAAWRAGG
ncbi:MAG: GrpB family protein [Dehalococcoidia bacterium]